MAMMTPQMNNYLASQQKRLTDAQKSGNKDLVTRLTNDIARFNKYTPLKPTTPYKPTVNNIVSFDSMKDDTSNQMVRTDNVPKQVNPVTNNVVNSNPSTTSNPTDGFNYNPMTDTKYKDYFQPQQAFSYDPKNDPMYQTMLQNALSQARANARVASQNALESLNDRGISNSSIAQNQLAQIEQNALTGAESQLNSSLLPQLVNQAYQRYQDDISNRNNQLNMARTLTNDAYNQYQDNVSNERDKRDYLYKVGQGEAEAKRLAEQMKLDWATLDWKQKQDLFDRVMRNKTLEETIRSNKANEGAKATNADANLTRAEASTVNAAANKTRANVSMLKAQPTKDKNGNIQDTFLKDLNTISLIVKRLTPTVSGNNYEKAVKIAMQDYNYDYLDEDKKADFIKSIQTEIEKQQPQQSSLQKVLIDQATSRLNQGSSGTPSSMFK